MVAARPLVVGVMIALGLALLPSVGRAEEEVDDTYASEAFLRELLCRGVADGASCGSNESGGPMTCWRRPGCSTGPSCVRCLEPDRPETTGPDPGKQALARFPHRIRIEETTEQKLRRLESSERLAGRTRLAWAAVLIAVLGASIVLFRLGRKARVPRWGFALAALGLGLAGVAWWRQRLAASEHLVVLAEIEHERTGRALPFTAPSPLPPDHWANPRIEAYGAKLRHLKRLLQARGIDWRAEARDAGESPNEY